MAFKLAPYQSYIDIPIAYVLELGGEEFLGLRGGDGNFQQISSLREVPQTDWQPVEMFGPSLGLLRPCNATIVLNEETIGHIAIRVVDGRPACVSITSLTHGLTGSLLRQIPLASLVRETATANTVRVLTTESGTFGARYVDGGAGFGQLHADLRAELVVVDERQRRRVLSPAFLSEVAVVYRKAVADGFAPSLTVQKTFGPTTRENARRWIATARQEGYLHPAPGPGKAGEI